MRGKTKTKQIGCTQYPEGSATLTVASPSARTVAQHACVLRAMQHVRSAGRSRPKTAYM